MRSRGNRAAPSQGWRLLSWETSVEELSTLLESSTSHLCFSIQYVSSYTVSISKHCSISHQANDGPIDLNLVDYDSYTSALESHQTFSTISLKTDDFFCPLVSVLVCRTIGPELRDNWSLVHLVRGVRPLYPHPTLCELYGSFPVTTSSHQDPCILLSLSPSPWSRPGPWTCSCSSQRSCSLDSCCNFFPIISSRFVRTEREFLKLDFLVFRTWDPTHSIFLPFLHFQLYLSNFTIRRVVQSTQADLVHAPRRRMKNHEGSWYSWVVSWHPQARQRMVRASPKKIEFFQQQHSANLFWVSSFDCSTDNLMTWTDLMNSGTVRDWSAWQANRKWETISKSRCDYQHSRFSPRKPSNPTHSGTPR